MGSDRGDRLRGLRSLHLLRDRAPQVRARRRPPGDVHLRRRSNPGARGARPARRPRGHARPPRLQGDALGPSLARSLPSLLGWLGHLSSRWRGDRHRSRSARPPAARRRSITRSRSGQDAGAVASSPRCSSAADRPGEDHKPIRLDETPKVLIDAVLAAEDHRSSRTAASILARCSAPGQPPRRQGQGRRQHDHAAAREGLALSPQRTFFRKLREAWLAALIESRHSRRILEAYLNEIYLGQRGPIAPRRRGGVTRTSAKRFIS